jgi:hypothetical protein
MGKSILELFESKPVSKQIPQDKPTSGTPQGGQFLIDRNNRVGAFFSRVLGTNDPLRETAFEQETNGNRVRTFVNQTALYGTDLIRITNQSTDVVDGMKAAKTSEANANLVAILDNANKIEGNSGFVGKVNRFLGIPRIIYPSSLRANPKFLEAAPRKPETLAEIRKDAAGTLFGRYLKDTGTGTPQQASKRVIGGGLSLAKGVIRNVLIGKEKVVQVTSGSLDNFNQKYYFGNTYQASMATQTTPDSKNTFDISLNSPIFGFDIKDGKFGKTRFSNQSSYGLELSYTTANPKKGEPDNIKLVSKYNTWKKDDTKRMMGPYDNGAGGAAKDVQLGPFGLALGLLESKSTILNFIKPKSLNRENWLKDRYTLDNNTKTVTSGGKRYDETLDKRRGLSSDRDVLNQTGRLTAGELESIKFNEKTLVNTDFAPLRFKSVSDGSAVYFRSIVSGFNETFSPSWEESRMIGSPFSFYTYQKIERKLTFNMKVYAMSQSELVMMWRRLEYLAHLTYPASYSGGGIVQPNLVKFTFGSIYNDKVCFIDALTYSIEDSENLWETGGGKVKNKRGRYLFDGTFYKDATNSGPTLSTTTTEVYETTRDRIMQSDSRAENSKYINEIYSKKDRKSNIHTETASQIVSTGNYNMDEYKLPKIINAAVGLTFIESRNDTTANIYGYGKPIT